MVYSSYLRPSYHIWSNSYANPSHIWYSVVYNVFSPQKRNLVSTPPEPLDSEKHRGCWDGKYACFNTKQIWLVVEPPIWKICSSDWIISPGKAEKKNETTTKHKILILIQGCCNSQCCLGSIQWGYKKIIQIPSRRTVLNLEPCQRHRPLQTLTKWLDIWKK